MDIGEEHLVNIDKITNLGAGITKIDNFVVFVDNACPGDYLKIVVTKVKKNYANAKIKEIITPSKYRTEPFCPMQKVCGACQIQYIDYNYQLELKKQIVEDAFRGLNINLRNPVPSPVTMQYRHKIQYPVSQTKNSKRILAGYYKPNSHDIVNIKYCPIQPKICDDIIDFIRENSANYGISGYEEKSHFGLLRHVVIRNSAHNGTNLVVLVVNDNCVDINLKNFAKRIYDSFDSVVGVCVNFNSKKTNVILGNKTICLAGEDYIIEKILDKTFHIGAETFFQVNPKSAENIFKYVKEYIDNNLTSPVVLDAYAGISAFGICVSDVCAKVVSIEENIKSVELAKISIKENNLQNIEIHSGDAGEFFEKEKRKFDVVILDPPRKGCSQKSLDEAYRLSKDTIIYVSCNPVTLSRDLKYLIEKGAKVQSVQPFDMFCHTYHIENVAIIKI